MKLVALSSCRVEGRTDMLHSCVYHGDAEKRISDSINDRNTRVDSEDFHHLNLLVGGNPLREFIQPTLSFVASSRIVGELNTIDCAQFLPVHFIHVVNLAVDAGDFSIPRHRLDFSSRASFLRSMPNCPELHPNDQYYELVVPNAYSSEYRYQNGFQVRIELPHLTIPEVELFISSKLLDECPVFWSSKTVFRREVFDVLESLSVLDPDYFTWCEFEV